MPRLGVAAATLAALGLSGCLEVENAVKPKSDAGADSGPSCQHSVCAEVVADWEGPFALLEQTEDPPALCPSGFAGAHVLYDYASGGTGQCSCSCELEGDCGGTLQMYTSTGCGTSCGSSYGLTPGGCFVSGGSCSALRGVLSSLNSCAPKVELAPAWGRVIRACIPSAYCANGCVPAGGVLGEVCVGRDGDLPCPQGYPARSLLHGGAQDGRQCTGCECGAPVCGTIQLYADANCSGAPVKSVSVPGTCAAIPAGGSADYVESKACALVQEPTLTGAVTPTEPYTVCCK